jgi:hypothetical protein
MMAKEGAAKLAETPGSRDDTLKAFVEEIGAVAQQRGGSVSAVEGAVREQRAKWPAVAPGLFESLLEIYGPSYKKAEQTARALAGGGIPQAGPWGRKGDRGRPR